MKFARIPVEKVCKYKKQPRQNFDNDALKQLIASIKEIGQLQPIIVQKQGNNYMLIAGERRLRAVKRIGEKEIAAMIIDKELNDFTIQQMQLVENLQRQDLNPMERAVFINNFIEQNKLTRKEASKKLGIARTTLTEWLNILEVKPKYQKAVLNEDSSLTLSHITLANHLAATTGDPTKISQLLNMILKYNLTREETRYILDLYNKHLHLSMEEAVTTVLIRRDRIKNNADNQKESDKRGNKTGKLIASFKRAGQNLEKIMETTARIDGKNKEKILDEFLYIYQLLEILIPEIQGLNKEELLSKFYREPK